MSDAIARSGTLRDFIFDTTTTEGVVAIDLLDPLCSRDPHRFRNAIAIGRPFVDWFKRDGQSEHGIGAHTNPVGYGSRRPAHAVVCFNGCTG
jgi:hypothetical protein